MVLFGILLDKIILSIVLGAFIGLEREYHRKMGVGVRTTAFLCLFGMLTTFFAFTYDTPLALVTGISIAGGFALSLFLYRTKVQRHAGLTTSTAIILTYFIGSMVALEFFREAIATAVIVFLLLFSKQKLVGSIRHLTEQEIMNAVEFAILAFVIYPFLPDYALLGVGIREVWGVVLVISAVSFAGFLAMRHFKSNGILLSSLLGSLLSSTAVIISNVHHYRRNKKLLNVFVLSSMLAFVVMAVRNMVVASFLIEAGIIILFASLIAASLAYMLVVKYLLRKLPQKRLVHELESPFAIKPALYFGLLFFVILAASRMAISYFGPEAILPVSMLAGIGSGYAVAASLALLFSQGAISAHILLASVVLSSIAGMLADTATIYAFRQFRLANRVLLFVIAFAALLVFVMFL